jgi:hypothetical protein
MTSCNLEKLSLLPLCLLMLVQSRGADPSLLTKETDSYLDPGRKGVLDVAVDDDSVKQQLAALNARYEGELHVVLPAYMLEII